MNQLFKKENRLQQQMKKNKSLERIFSIKRRVFAFQQMDEATHKPKNDKDIYNSIITTIKALEYERNLLLKNSEKNAFYHFFLLSVFEVILIKRTEKFINKIYKQNI